MQPPSTRAHSHGIIELPIAFDAITVVAHPQNDCMKILSVADLKKIWEPAAQATIVRWSQVQPEWPDAPLMLFGPGADSGTFDYFAEAIVGKASRAAATSRLAKTTMSSCRAWRTTRIRWATAAMNRCRARCSFM